MTALIAAGRLRRFEGPSGVEMLGESRVAGGHGLRPQAPFSRARAQFANRRPRLGSRDELWFVIEA